MERWMGLDAATNPAFPWSPGLSRFTHSLTHTLDFSLTPKTMAVGVGAGSRALRKQTCINPSKLNACSL